MPLVVEDGTGTDALANTYTSLADANVFLSDRGLDSVVDANLYMAMDVLVGLDYKSTQLVDTQPLPYPREDFELYTSSQALALIKTAQIWIASYIQQGFNPGAVAGGGTAAAALASGLRKAVVGPIEVEYFQESSEGTNSVGEYTLTDLPNALAIIRPLLNTLPASSDGTIQNRVIRA